MNNRLLGLWKAKITAKKTHFSLIEPVQLVLVAGGMMGENAENYNWFNSVSARWSCENKMHLRLSTHSNPRLVEASFLQRYPEQHGCIIKLLVEIIGCCWLSECKMLQIANESKHHKCTKVRNHTLVAMGIPLLYFPIWYFPFCLGVLLSVCSLWRCFDTCVFCKVSRSSGILRVSHVVCCDADDIRMQNLLPAYVYFCGIIIIREQSSAPYKDDTVARAFGNNRIKSTLLSYIHIHIYFLRLLSSHFISKFRLRLFFSSSARSFVGSSEQVKSQCAEILRTHYVCRCALSILLLIQPNVYATRLYSTAIIIIIDVWYPHTRDFSLFSPRRTHTNIRFPILVEFVALTLCIFVDSVASLVYLSLNFYIIISLWLCDHCCLSILNTFNVYNT